MLNLGHQHPKMFGKKGSKILKLPPVRNCFTLTMTNKLVFIINSLKYQKLRKFYYMKWNFLYQITAASRTRNLCPLSSTEFVEPPPPKKIPGYATASWSLKHIRFVLMVSFGRHVQPTDVVFGGLFIWLIDFSFVEPLSCT